MAAAEMQTQRATGDRGATDDRTLLDAALTGHRWADGELCDRHAGALFCLAEAVLISRAAAATVVVGVVADACTRSGLVSLGGGRSLRHELARLTYERCAGSTARSDATQQRALLALCVHGAHTYRQAGALVGLPEPDVPGMLRAGLLGLPQPRLG